MNKVVCIDNYTHSFGKGKFSAIEIGKTYSLISEDDDYYFIDDGHGNILGSGGYYKSRFISLKEYRKQKLNKISENS